MNGCMFDFHMPVFDGVSRNDWLSWLLCLWLSQLDLIHTSLIETGLLAGA